MMKSHPQPNERIVVARADGKAGLDAISPEGERITVRAVGDFPNMRAAWEAARASNPPGGTIWLCDEEDPVGTLRPY